ncbi:MAG: phosphomannomutase/phosphoglucomutase [Clostridiaceae bacterium]
MSFNYKNLQNGTDIRGIALEGIENEHVNLTEEICEKFALSFSLWLSKEKNKKINDLKIAIGMDSRLSGPNLKKALIKGFISYGVQVYDCNLASTPAMFMTCVTEPFYFDGSIMVTASHLPFNRNGLKFFTEKGGLEKEDISEIINIAENEKFLLPCSKGSKLEIDFISVYSNKIADFIRKEVNSSVNYDMPLSGLKIVVDAGNGAGGFFATKILEPLGANIEGSQFLNPDGNFPNHIPNPENKEAMESIRAAVLDSNADFGIIFDTDVDRAAAVDENGDEINRNKLIALISAIILEKSKGATIVTDSITSNGLKTFIEEDLGGIHHRFKRGYKNVINEAIRLNALGQNTELAIETSGHAALKENYFLDDGAYLIAKILIKLAKLKQENKSIHSLINTLKLPLESVEFRMKINTEDFRDYGNKIIDALNIYANKNNWIIVPNNYEGVRISFPKENGDGWFLLRLSLHDPIIPVNIESDSVSGVLKISNYLNDFLNDFTKLNLDPIKTYIKNN